MVHQLNSYAVSIYKFLKDKEVEVYCGDQGETHQFSETQRPHKSIIRGIVKDADNDCLVITVKRGTLSADVYLNGYNIISIIKVSDPLFVMDIYEDEYLGKKK